MLEVRRCVVDDLRDWLPLRQALWPDCPPAEQRAEIAAWLADPANRVAFAARDARGAMLGFVEASVRHEYVNGSESSPVGFVEGLYVRPDARRRGVARRLVAAVQAWARERGLRELCSDADLANDASHALHRALGFVETERVVCFRQDLSG